MSISSRLEAINQHLLDDYSILTLAGADLTNVDKNILNLKQSWEERLLYFLANGTDVVWNNWLPKVTGSGETITLNNTIEAKMDFVYKGNTSQTGTPTPDTPIPVQVVSGDNTIKVEGKNLFDGVFRQGNRFTDGLSETTRLFTTQNYPVKSGVSYTLSTTINTSTYKWAVNLSTSEYPILNITPSSQYYDSGWKTSNSFTFTPSQDGYLGIVVAKTNGSDALTPSDIASVNWQLEYGSTATPYEPYQSQTYPINIGDIELCKIGDYQDYIYKDSGKWYLHKEIGKITLSNSDNFILDSYSLRFTKVLDTTYEKEGYSNRYIYGGTYQTTGKFEILNNGRLAFSYPDSNIDTVAKLQTYLTTNELYMYLPLSNSTTTEITDTTLINQLEAIKKSYNTQTSISQVNNDLHFELDVVALGELD